MLESLWPSAGWYILFSFFVYHQQLHGKTFRGGSEAFGLTLSIFAFAGMLAGLTYLGFIAYTITWWAPIPAFITGALLTGISSGLLVSTQDRLLAASMSGFVAWPACAYFMFTTAPA